YGPEQGYEFLRSTIAQHDYRSRNIDIADDEIFVSDGSKCDCGYILDILGDQNKVAVPDPVYPVYVDTNVMAGHTGPSRKDGSYEGIYYLPCTAENNFVPEPPTEHVDLVYLCFPNNPTGAVASRAQLARWVDYAHEHDALLLFDAAYEAYISDPEIPHSIFEIPGALANRMRNFRIGNVRLIRGIEEQKRIVFMRIIDPACELRARCDGASRIVWKIKIDEIDMLLRWFGHEIVFRRAGQIINALVTAILP